MKNLSRGFPSQVKWKLRHFYTDSFREDMQNTLKNRVSSSSHKERIRKRDDGKRESTTLRPSWHPWAEQEEQDIQHRWDHHDILGRDITLDDNWTTLSLVNLLHGLTFFTFLSHFETSLTPKLMGLQMPIPFMNSLTKKVTKISTDSLSSWDILFLGFVDDFV